MDDSEMTQQASAPTLSSISESLGVSVSTVSRALKHHPSISEATRQRVEQEAERVGYAPNPYISALMHSLKARRPVPYRATLAIIDTLDSAEAWKDFAVQREFQAGAEKRARELGYKLERHWVDFKASPARLTQILYSRGIPGLLVLPVDPLSAYAGCHPVDYSKFSCVTLGTRMADPALHFCMNDQLATGQIAAQALIRLGYRRLGLALPDYVDMVVGQRFSLGFRGAIEAAGLRLPGKAVLRYSREAPRGQATFQAWLKDYRPDAVCGSSAEIRGWAERTKCRVPHDLAMALLDLGAEHSDWAGVRQNNFLVGSNAVNLLVQCLYENIRGAPTNAQGMVIEGEWIDGASAPGLVA